MTLKERQNLLNQITVIINNMAVDDEDKPTNESHSGKVELLTVKECAEAVGGLSECTVANWWNRTDCRISGAERANAGRYLFQKPHCSNILEADIGIYVKFIPNIIERV